MTAIIKRLMLLYDLLLIVKIAAKTTIKIKKKGSHQVCTLGVPTKAETAQFEDIIIPLRRPGAFLSEPGMSLLARRLWREFWRTIARVSTINIRLLAIFSSVI